MTTESKRPDENLGEYAQRAYLEYALSVVKGRALPDVCDGLKPVQRRILYAMDRMGLSYSGATNNVAPKPVKSARVVGDVLGRFHPHGDQSAYDALVRMAQDFSQRYPLIDGQGNFGSRDGDGAAAMRYTEARLSKITRLLMDEIDEGTVDFVPNYDGSTVEPKQQPSRLPFILLNGASGIAVGLATEIPSHNLREIADACVALIKNPELAVEELATIIPGPDYPGGGQVISSVSDITECYRTGRGSLKVRARWKIEDLARGQWQMVVNELPPGVSSQRVLEEIEEITNPKVKVGKKTLTQEQNQLKASMLAVLDCVRDESSKDAAVRLVFEPKSGKTPQQELITALLAHTSLESSSSINLTMVGLDGKPVLKSMRQMLDEWIEFRQKTITRRTQHRLNKVLDRIHILEGRHTVLLHIDEVINIIRTSDNPKEQLIAKFNLSDRQAEDILDIKLRQLARLEALKIEQELSDLRAAKLKLEDILGNSNTLCKLMIKEIETDSKQFGDDRRTLLQAEKRAAVEVKVVDEPVTVVISEKGWVRVRHGHECDPGALSFKPGDKLHQMFKCRTVDNLVAVGKSGRAYSVAVAQLPNSRGDGQPITTFCEVEPCNPIKHYFAGAGGIKLLVACTDGYGFITSVIDMLSRKSAGKSFVGVEHGHTVASINAIATDSAIVCITDKGRMITLDQAEVRYSERGGRGLVLMPLNDGERLVVAVGYNESVTVSGNNRRGTLVSEVIKKTKLDAIRVVRGRRSAGATLSFAPITVESK